jgi:hypothetical protein
MHTLESFLKITKAAKNFGLPLPQQLKYINFSLKWVGLRFGRFFTQTHLVTLVEGRLNLGMYI